jgi:cytochrome d ubiquinol oxidase subunit II
MAETILQLAWFGIMALGLGLFVVLDGADLGIGALSLAARDEKERSLMVAAIGPMWYANETWLVIAGAVLFGAFPLAYAILFSSLYIPSMFLLLGLILRAVSTEFRVHSDRKGLWSTAFGIGSLLAILAQGFMLGGLLSGIKVSNGQFAGGPWDWLNPASILVTVGIASGYAMLGASAMVRRTEGEFEKRNRRLLRITAAVSVAMFIAVIAVLPLASPAVSRVWLEPPRPIVSSIFFAGTLLSFALLLASIPRQTSERTLYALGLMVFICASCAVVSAIFPYFIPLSVTIADAAAPSQTLVFMLIGVGVILPIIAVYNLYTRGIFRGKVRGGDEEQY